MVLYGTATLAPIDGKGKPHSIPSKPQIVTDELQHNAIDVDSPTEVWNSDTEVTILLLLEFPHTGNFFKRLFSYKNYN